MFYRELILVVPILCILPVFRTPESRSHLWQESKRNKFNMILPRNTYIKRKHQEDAPCINLFLRERNRKLLILVSLCNRIFIEMSDTTRTHHSLALVLYCIKYFLMANSGLTSLLGTTRTVLAQLWPYW